MRRHEGGKDEPPRSLKAERSKQSRVTGGLEQGAEGAMEDDIGEAGGDAVQGWVRKNWTFTRTDMDSQWTILGRGMTMTSIMFQKDCMVHCGERTMESGERVEAGRPPRSLLQRCR